MISNLEPKVSIVMPYFNAQETLERAVNSILHQTYSNFELLLVNNNSSDNSPQIATRMASTDQRIRILNETVQGVVFAANKGNSAAKGQYIARMDADDVSLPARIEKQVMLLDSKPEIGVASCLAEHLGHHQKTDGINQYVDWVNSLRMPHEIELNRFVEMPLINPTTMFRRDLIGQFGGFLHGNFPEDYELWLRWMNYGVKIEKVPEVLFQWHDSDTRLTRTDPRYSIDAFYQTKAAYLSKWLLSQNHQHVWVWGAGRVTRKRVDFLAQTGILIEGYIDIKKREFDETCCISFNDFDWQAPSFILSYVGNRGAREKIRQFLFAKGKIEGSDFLMVA